MIAAVCGKGGVGKTTVSALAARAFLKDGRPKVLFIDADPAGGLSMALGLNTPTTLDHVHKHTVEAIRDRSADRRDLAASIDYLVAGALVERGNLALLSIGRPEESGCYCQVHQLLREAVKMLAGRFDVTWIDAEAGVEQINRRVMARVDRLLLVTDASAKGVRVAETIEALAGETMDVGRAGMILNRVRSSEQASRVEESTRLPVIARLPENDAVRTFDEEARPFFDLPNGPATGAVHQMLLAEGLLTN